MHIQPFSARGEYTRGMETQHFDLKCEALSCTNYHEIKLMSHMRMKIWESVIESRLRGALCQVMYHRRFCFEGFSGVVPPEGQKDLH